MPTNRQPAALGRFYPAAPDALRSEIERCLGAVPARGAEQLATAIILPHAGYVYSGRVAGAVVSTCRVPDRALVLGPNHTGLGARRALHPAGSFELPGASVVVDAALTAQLAAEAELTLDAEAHRKEHSIEVELPFLLAKNPKLSIAALCLSRLALRQCRSLAEGVARVLASAGGSERVLLVASTDMSHYESAERAQQLDTQAIDRILALDPEGLFQVVQTQQISMCGFIPTTIALFAAVLLGARTATLVKYAHSGLVSGDYERVVGYAGIVVH